jgi:pantoate kinase
MITRHFEPTDPLSAISFGPIHTPSVLSSLGQMELVSSAFPHRTPVDLNDFFRLCRSFDEKSGLQTTEVREALEACDRAGIPAAMTMLGNGVFACRNTSQDVLAEYGEVYEFSVAQSGPYIVGEKP